LIECVGKPPLQLHLHVGVDPELEVIYSVTRSQVKLSILDLNQCVLGLGGNTQPLRHQQCYVYGTRSGHPAAVATQHSFSEYLSGHWRIGATERTAPDRLQAERRQAGRHAFGFICYSLQLLKALRVFQLELCSVIFQKRSIAFSILDDSESPWSCRPGITVQAGQLPLLLYG